MKKIIVIPTYNEKANCVRMIQTLRALYPETELLFIDDGSPDGTGAIIQAIAEQDDAVHLLSRTEKAGLGSAYTAGFKWCMDYGVDTLITMDCDFSHDPEDVKKLQAVLDNGTADIAVGSRYSNGIRILNWSFKRLLLSYLASLYSQKWLRLPILDPTSGFVGYQKEVIQAYLTRCPVRFNGYVFQVLMKYFGWKNKYKVQEVDITFSERAIGETKMHFGIIFEAILGVFTMKFHVKKG